MEKKLTSRQLKAMQTRSHIIKTAYRLFGENSYDKVTIQDICREANVSIGGFYHYFKSKFDIIDDSYRVFDDEVKTSFETNQPDNCIKSIIFLISIQCDHIESLGVLSFSQLLKQQLGIDNPYILNSERFFTIKLCEIVKEAVDKNILFGDSDNISNEILSTTRGLIYDWCLHNGSYNLKERSLHLTNMIVNFYRK